MADETILTSNESGATAISGTEGTTVTPVTPVPANDFTDYVGSDLKFRANWRESLPEEIRAAPSLETIPGINELVKGYVNAQTMVGLKKVAVPDVNSSPDIWNEFYKKTGRPEEATNYAFDNTGIPENLVPTEENLNAAKTMMHELGLSDKQASGVYSYYNTLLKQGAELEEVKQNQAYDEGVAALKSQYGYTYEKNIEIGNRAIRTFDPDGVLEDAGMLNNPKIVDILVKVGKAISEDKLIGETVPIGLTPNDAETKIKALRADPSFINFDHPNHGTTITEIGRLSKFMYPEAGEIRSMSLDPSTGQLVAG
jgi:hypothetical protein